jgi:hypothetical protein
LVFVHELGHAVAAVALTRRRTRIQIGQPPYWARFSLGRIDVEYAPRGYMAHCLINPRAGVSGRQLLLIALAGPIASLLTSLGLAASAVALHDGPSLMFWILVLAAFLSLAFGVGNLIPLRGLPAWWPGAMETGTQLSDGYLVLVALRLGLSTRLPPADAELEPGLTERSTHALIAARRIAVAEGCSEISTDHILRGLAGQDDGVAAAVLHDCGFRTDPPAWIPEGDEDALDLTPAIRRSLRLARASLTLRGDVSLDTEHLLGAPDACRGRHRSRRGAPSAAGRLRA